MIKLKRVYELPSPTDGYRVLVDRLWPRGQRRADAHIDAWVREVAPSPELRRWFGHEPSRFEGFRDRYRRELHNDPARAALADLARRAERGNVTLVYAAHDEVHNNAIVLQQAIRRRLGRRGRSTRRTRASRPNRA